MGGTWPIPSRFTSGLLLPDRSRGLSAWPSDGEEGEDLGYLAALEPRSSGESSSSSDLFLLSDGDSKPFLLSPVSVCCLEKRN